MEFRLSVLAAASSTCWTILRGPSLTSIHINTYIQKNPRGLLEQKSEPQIFEMDIQWWVWWALGKQTVGPLIDLWFEIVWTSELSWTQRQKPGNREALEWIGQWGTQQPSLLFTASQSGPRSECSLSLDNLSVRFGIPRTIDLAGILAPGIPLNVWNLHWQAYRFPCKRKRKGLAT